MGRVCIALVRVQQQQQLYAVLFHYRFLLDYGFHHKTVVSLLTENYLGATNEAH